VTAAHAEVRELHGEALEGWDAAAVAASGGHVLQSRAWAEHRAGGGWTPRFLAVGELRALALVRPWPGLGGGSAYLPRGPVGPTVPWSFEGGDAIPGAGAAIGGALAAVSAHLVAEGIDVVAADPEVAGDDGGYLAVLGAAGFVPIAEIQPSRHRMALPLADADEAAVLAGVSKPTRQRIRRAERDGIVVVRHDTASSRHEGILPATEDAGAALDRFYELLVATGERRGFGLAADAVGWWRRALTAGHLVLLEAREGAADGTVLGGLILYRHGTRLSTAHSADRADRRRDHPGAMHLLRWRAIQLALAEGCAEMDLGGVDVAGARRPPVEGEPTWGLYEHKRSFGAAWVELAGAHEHVARGWRYAAGRATSRAARLVGRGRGAT